MVTSTPNRSVPFAILIPSFLHSVFVHPARLLEATSTSECLSQRILEDLLQVKKKW